MFYLGDQRWHPSRRATFTTFRDLSWIAFARQIDHTVFDLASRNSMENLQAVSNTRTLTPWIKRLSITLHVVEHHYSWRRSNHKDDFEGALENIDPVASQRFDDIKTGEQSWYPETLSLWSDIMGNDSITF
jgi:hypothetical protein